MDLIQMYIIQIISKTETQKLVGKYNVGCWMFVQLCGAKPLVIIVQNPDETMHHLKKLGSTVKGFVNRN